MAAEPRSAALSRRPLKVYTDKRDFSVTPEPKADGADGAGTARAAPDAPLSFVIQKHWASRLHYDFRLELDGVLVSWALPKALSFDPADKRMAVHVEDHPLAYGGFEGTIPKGHYGAGTVIVWDRGTWEPVGDPQAGLAAGKLLFRLHGEKLAGLWELVRIGKPSDPKHRDQWILFKKRDAWARPLAEYDVLRALPDSVIAKPLGPIEAREPREAPGPRRGGAPAGGASPARSAADLPGAVRAPLPASLAPQLAGSAVSVDALPGGHDWILELKFDGYRLLARLDAQGRATLFTRNGHDWTAKMRPLAAALEATGWKDCWLDGEIVVLGADGAPDFNALQNAIDTAGGRGGGRGDHGDDGIRYFVFDLPHADGHDLRRVPLRQRRALLEARFAALHRRGPHGSDADDGAVHDDRVRLSSAFDADPASLLESARRLGLEGIIAKRADAPYVSRRSDTWLKLKTHARQELVIGGFVDREGAPHEVGSLILGVFDRGGHLVHAGSVGTGWDSRAAAELRARLVPIEQKTPPFEAGSPDPGRWSRRGAGRERWVRPELVAEVRFAGWTPAGHVRHAVFVGLRHDKPARAVRREAAPEPSRAAGTAPAAAVAVATPTITATRRRGASPPRAAAAHRIAITHPERVIDAASGLTKLDLVRHYESVAERLLPHLAGRPVALVRGPEGTGGPLFFQKHDEAGSIPGLKQLDPTLWPEHAPLITVPDAKALLACAQMNVIEFHTWNATAKAIHRPDRIVFDLDPGEGVAWPRVQEAAVLVRTLLTELGLESWLKTSGGKGLHVVVPIAPKLPTDEVKAFAQAAVQHLAATIPSRFVAKSGPANRVGRIFVDYLRNGFGATTAAAFSARARPGLGVSMPVAWDDLDAIKGGATWTVANAREHLSFETADPWAGFFGRKQTLARALKTLGLATAAPAR